MFLQHPTILPPDGDVAKSFQHLFRKGYQGIVGMEHGVAGSGKEGELALIRAYAEVDSLEV